MRLRGIAFAAATAVGAVLSFGGPASAGVVGVDTVTALNPNDSIDWGQLGPPYTRLSGPQTVTSAGGVSATLSSAGGVFERRNQNACCGGPSGGWAGGFPSGEHILWDAGAGPDVTINFAAPVRGVGVQIVPDYPGPYSAEIIGSNGGVLGSFTGAKSDYIGTLFVGLLSTTADISEVRFDLPSANGAPNDFAIGTLYLNTTPTGPVPANLVANPNFDAEGAPQGVPDNWTLTPAASGSNFAVDAGPSGPVSSPNSALFEAYGSDDDELSQVLNTTPGQKYSLSFELAHDQTDDQNDFSVQFGGNTIFSLVNAAAFGWTQETFTVTATSPQTTLAFFGREVPSLWDLDNVSVTAVPEPATWAMLMLGIGGIGVAMRNARRRDRAALAAG